jgi:hypothetical protein
MEQCYAHTNNDIYILANRSRKPYIGVIADIVVRRARSRRKENPDCDTAKYNLDQGG